MLLEDLQVVVKVAEFRSITAAATRLDMPTPTELWLVCPSRQSITPAARLLRDAFKNKSTGILNQLIEKGILDDSVVTQGSSDVSQNHGIQV
jgi:DNA-binding transcriptional LysR family regulator